MTADDAPRLLRPWGDPHEFEAYGYRRVGADLRHRSMIVSSKKIRRLMREHDLQPKPRKRVVATTPTREIKIARRPAVRATSANGIPS